jgi:hypothetical protein
MKNERVAIQREGEERYAGATSGKMGAGCRTRRGSAVGSGSAIPVDSTSK